MMLHDDDDVQPVLDSPVLVVIDEQYVAEEKKRSENGQALVEAS
jgi:hypothetical protein